MSLARSLGFVLLGFAAGVLVTGQTTEAQLELGQCRFAAERDGVFYQADRYTRNYLTPRCASLGLAGRWGESKWGWRLAVLVTGQIQARDNVTTLHDSEMGRHDLACDPTPSTPNHGCLQRHTGSGSVRGISASLTRELFVHGPWSLSGEAGLFFHESRWASRPSHVDCNGCWQHPDYDAGQGSDMLKAMPATLVGLTVRYGSVYFAARRYESPGGRPLSLTDGTFTQLSAGVAWRI